MLAPCAEGGSWVSGRMRFSTSEGPISLPRVKVSFLSIWLNNVRGQANLNPDTQVCKKSRRESKVGKSRSEDLGKGRAGCVYLCYDGFIAQC